MHCIASLQFLGFFDPSCQSGLGFLGRVGLGSGSGFDFKKIIGLQLGRTLEQLDRLGGIEIINSAK